MGNLVLHVLPVRLVVVWQMEERHLDLPPGLALREGEQVHPDHLGDQLLQVVVWPTEHHGQDLHNQDQALVQVELTDLVARRQLQFHHVEHLAMVNPDHHVNQVLLDRDHHDLMELEVPAQEVLVQDHLVLAAEEAQIVAAGQELPVHRLVEVDKVLAQ